jgi:hypothetical protein
MDESSPRPFTKSHRKGNFMVMARNTNQFAIAMLFGTLLLGIPVLCAGKTAKTCPACVLLGEDVEPEYGTPH